MSRKSELELSTHGAPTSRALCGDDEIEKAIEDVFMDKLTCDQRITLVVEYRASADVPALKTSVMKSALIGISPSCYRKRLQISRRIIANALNIL